MGEPSSPRAGLTGGVGEMSTPELLAKREQRRRMEAQAAALSRPTLARKLLHPVQQHAAGQQAAMQHQHQHQPSSVSGLAGQQGGRSIFSRAGLKRPAPTAQTAAPAPAADTGVSAAELAKLMEDDPAAEEQQPDEQPGAKRPKLSDLLQQAQPQPKQDSADQLPAMRPTLLTMQQRDKNASVSTAFGRVAAQRHEHHQQQEEQQVKTEWQQQEQQAEIEQQRLQQQQRHHQMEEGSCREARQDKPGVQPLQDPSQRAIPTQPQPQPHQQQQQQQWEPGASNQPQVQPPAAPAAAAATCHPEAPGNIPRWMYVKPGTAAEPQQQEQEQAAAAGGTSQAGRGSKGRGQGRGGRGRGSSSKPAGLAAEEQAQGAAAVAAEAEGVVPSKGKARKRPRQQAAAETPPASAAAAVVAAAAAAAAAAAGGGRVSRPRRQAAAAATRALQRSSTCEAAADGSQPEHSVDSDSDGGGGSGSGSSACSSDEEPAGRKQQQIRPARPSRGRSAAAAAAAEEPAAAAADVAAGAKGSRAAGPKGSRAAGKRKSSAAGAAAEAGAAAAAKPVRRAHGHGKQQAVGGAQLNKHLQKLQDAVSNSRRAQQMSAALEQQQADPQAPPQQQQQQQQVRSRCPFSKAPLLAASKVGVSKQQADSRVAAVQSAAAAGDRAAAGGGGGSAAAVGAAAVTGQQHTSHLQLLPDLAAKVQAALAAKTAAGAAAAVAAAAAAAAVAAAAAGSAAPGSHAGGAVGAAAAGSAAAVTACADDDVDMLLLDESDDLEIVDAVPAAAATAPASAAACAAAAEPVLQPAQQQQQPGVDLDDADDAGGIDLGVDGRSSEQEMSDDLVSEEAGDSSSGWEETSGSDGDEGEEEGAEGWEEEGAAHGDGASSSCRDSDGDGECDRPPVAKRAAARRRAVQVADSSSSGEEGDEGGEGDEGDEDDVPIGRRAAAGRRRRSSAAAACSGSGSDEECWEVEEDKPQRRAAKPRAARAKGSRAPGTKRATAAAAAAAEGEADDLTGDAEGSKPKPKRRSKAASATAAEGGVKKRSAASKARAKAAGGAKASKPRTRKPAQRSNFRRHKTSASGYGSSFLSKAAVKGGANKKWAYKGITKSGRLIRVRRKAPHMAGQGAEYMEGFAGCGGGGKGRCYRCGQEGHWEDDCPLLAAQVAEQEAERLAWIRDNPDAEEAQRVAGGDGTAYHAAAGADGTDGAAAAAPAVAAAPGAQGGTGPPAAAAAAAATKQQAAAQQQQPVRQPPLTQQQLCEMAGLAPDAPWHPEQLTEEQLARVLKTVWGHSGFRGQQLPLIRAALNGTSMLGVLPTGLGKSMTYQLPALLLQGLVVVVSPLLSLMHDQVSRLPPCVPGAMLQGNMSRDAVTEVLSEAESGKLRLLYLAPEKLSAFPVQSCLRRLNLALVVVDEAHCMAEWGEGFRPSYFRLGHLLTNHLHPRAVLALTATAPPATRASILQLLHIPPEHQVVESPLRSNLRLRVVPVPPGSAKEGRVGTLIVGLFKSGELSNVQSAVVYVGFRYAADALAAQLKRAGINSAAYHAGLAYDQREFVQNAFLRGHIRVMVATIAFGMGLDKPDLEAVLHTNMPKSLEEYVQQVGRAGRDGRNATCVAFLDDNDYIRSRALSHQRCVKREGVERFLRIVFGREEDEVEPEPAPAAGGKAAKRRVTKAKERLAPSQHKVLPITAFCTEQDIDKEVLDSCLSFLQADPLEPYVTVLTNVPAVLQVRFHKKPAEVLAGSHPVVQAILDAKTRRYQGCYKVHMGPLVATADRPPGDLMSELSALSQAKEIGYDADTQNQALSWRLLRQPEDWDALVDDAHARCDKVVTATVTRLDRVYEALAGAAIYGSAAAQEQHMRAMIENYFLEDALQPQGQDAAAAAAAGAEGSDAADADAGDNMLPWGVPHPILRVSRDSLLRQLRAVMHNAAQRARDLGRGRFDGLVLARMVAGLSSPAVPQTVWKGCSEWGRMAAHDFRRLADAAEVVVQDFWLAEGSSRLRTMN